MFSSAKIVEGHGGTSVVQNFIILHFVKSYEGESISNQPIPFPMTETVTIFKLCFNTCFIRGYKIARLSSHSLIECQTWLVVQRHAEYRAVIRYLYLADVYGSSAPTYAQVKFWVGEFKRGRTSLEDEARSERPLGATDEEMCKKVRYLVYYDRRIQVEEIAQALSISHGIVSTILHGRLGMRKLKARWVLKSLSDEQMATRASVCSALLKRFSLKDDFLLDLVTVDEILVHYHEPGNKAQSSVGRAWVPEAICWQGDCHSILGRKRRYYVGLLTQEK